MKIGTCDCCQAQNVELSRGDVAGLETWSCAEGCDSERLKAEIIRAKNRTDLRDADA